ncbi:MAG: beta-galactosidase GalA [Terracidiphilus sp.]|jgi:beta-galactosidase
MPAVAAAASGMNPVEAAMHMAGESSGPLPADGSDAAKKPSAAITTRERLSLDYGWRFHLGDACDVAKDFGFGSGRAGNFQKTGGFLAASSLGFDDNDWKAVDLPHDWAIELPFTNDPALESKGFYPLGRNYPATSIGWYRRVFEIPAVDKGKRISLEFEGAYRETTVVMNGFYIGQHSGGYDPFRFDVTDFVNPGGRNVLLVRVDATESDGWFYEGAGIYRHVWLVKTNPVHVRQWGTFVRSEIKAGVATLSIRTEVKNEGQAVANVRVVSSVLDPVSRPAGKMVTATVAIPVGAEQTFEQKVTVTRPQLWSLEDRILYTLVTEVRAGGDVVDRYETLFGIRTIKFDAQKGFFLNGEPLKVKGTCNHQDHAGLGAALPDSVQYYRIRKLKQMGSNALRTSHNPPTPALLDACDDLGMLVFDETRMMSSNPDGLSQFENLVRRDRNRPSVFMWSMGNEEGTANTEKGALILTEMKAVATRHDGTRPVSIAPTGAIGTGGLAVCDVIGYNYMDPQAEDYHRAHPDKPVIGTETVSAVGTRGIYVTDYDKGYVGSYDPYTTTGRASAEGWWSFCNARPWLAGGFVWTGFDYRGEPSPNGWPNISSQYGVVDTCGFSKDTFYYYQSWWTEDPVLHLFPHWNWPGMEGKEIAVWVHSNLDKVELLLNGRSLGEKEMRKDSHLAWNVPYARGVLEARGTKNGELVLADRRETTDPPAALAIYADRAQIAADGEDVAMLTVEVRDGRGRVVPIAGNLITFKVTGAGKLIGVGNGDPTDQDSGKGPLRKAFSGLCMAIVQSTKSAGNIMVEATSPRLVSAQATVWAGEVPLRPRVAAWEREVPRGAGITGLWRPAEGGGALLFIFVQSGSTLTGTAEGIGGSWAGGYDAPTPITDGQVDGANVSFRAGNSTFSGRINEDTIELERTSNAGSRPPRSPAQREASVLAVGPPPDGSDPSRSPLFRSAVQAAMVLHRAER